MGEKNQISLKKNWLLSLLSLLYILSLFTVNKKKVDDGRDNDLLLFIEEEEEEMEEEEEEEEEMTY